MINSIDFYKKQVERALKDAKKYNKSLHAQVMALAGAMKTIDLANNEIDSLTETTISTVSRYGNETLAPHPVFKILKDAQESVTKQMKALGLTTADLVNDDDKDPLYEITAKVMNAGKTKGRKKTADDRK